MKEWQFTREFIAISDIILRDCPICSDKTGGVMQDPKLIFCILLFDRVDTFEFLTLFIRAEQDPILL